MRQLEAKGLLRDERVREAFLAVPREHFVPEVSLEAAYRDEAILTKRTEAGHGLSSSSQPAIMAIMLEALQLEPGHRVLEIGAGTGYNAALLARLVGDRGRVVSVDIDPETAAGARRALKGTRAKVVNGDGRGGYEPGAPYDRIVATASASEVPRPWLEQVREGGLVEVPLRLRGSDSLQLIPTFRREGDRLRSVSTTLGGFMPLRAAPDDLSPYWPALNVTRAEGGRAAQLISLYGEAVRTLSERAARRLVATACSEPRSRKLRPRPTFDTFGVFLALQAPRRRLVGVMDGESFAAGLISRDGRSLALLRGWHRLTRMLVYGTDEAADALERIVLQWEERGRPGVDDVRLTVSFGAGSSTVRTRWHGR